LTVTLPDTGNVQTGHQVEVVDEGGNAATNNITVTQNSANSPNINDASSDQTLSTNYGKLTFTWTGSQWIAQ